jgi:D-beta-D-heptose 7-phosphate kinase/D-beta-D-heptose 1-phosphate adenosyltransferase
VNNTVHLLNLAKQIETSRGEVTTIGDVIFDAFTFGSNERTSSEAPVPVIQTTRKETMPGGAGNVAANIAALGGKSKLIGVIGMDTTGIELRELLRKHEIDTDSMVIDPQRPTTKKERFLDGDTQLLCVARESREVVAPWVIEKVINTLMGNGYSIVVITDYNRGMVSPELIRRTIEICSQQGKKVIVDVHIKDNFDITCLQGAYLITPNRKEAATLLGKAIPDDHQSAELIARHMAEQIGTNVLLTRDNEGMTLVTTDGAVNHIPALEQNAICVSGAGDTVVGTISLALASNIELIDAVKLSAYTAAVVVGKIGTATVTMHELTRVIESLSKAQSVLV